MIRVAIVDDHQLFSDGLAMALNAMPDISVAATFTDGAQFLNRMSALELDVVLLDLEMPAISGLDVLGNIVDPVKAIIVSMHNGRKERTRAKELGAAGVLSKSAPLADVAAAIRAVHDRRELPAVNPTLRELLDEYRSATLDPGAAALTQRERELLSLMARGITATDDLADALFISQKTVKNHLASIYHKLAISDRAQAAVEAIRLGLGGE